MYGRTDSCKTPGAGQALCWVLLALVICGATSCDRTSVRGPVGDAPDAVAGPRSVDSGVLFAFEDPAAQSVHLAGTFNDWSTSADPMSKDAGGRWTLVKPLGTGVHQYKFVVNGGQEWKPDPNNSEKTDDGFGGHNSVLEITSAGIKRVASAPAATPATASGASGAQGGPEKVDGGWRFTFVSAGAQSVHLAGSFNDWSTSADPMAKDSKGTWVLVKKLSPGEHQYKFVVNGGDWKEDPKNPNTADDGFGGANSLLVVP